MKKSVALLLIVSGSSFAFWGQNRATLEKEMVSLSGKFAANNISKETAMLMKGSEPIASFFGFYKNFGECRKIALRLNTDPDNEGKFACSTVTDEGKVITVSPPIPWTPEEKAAARAESELLKRFK